jgi:peptidase E
MTGRDVQDRCIIVMGGGGFSEEPANPRLDDYVLSCVERPRPKVCFIPTASGDADSYIVKFYTAFKSTRCEPSHLALFNRTVGDLREVLLSQDIVYVGGGNTSNLLAVWRLHGFDAVLREAWEQGVILCGVSAGAICWHEAGVTDSFGTMLQPLRNGLGFLRGSFCPHYDAEAHRRPTFQRLIVEGEIPPGLAADNGVAVRYAGTGIAEVVASKPGIHAWRVEPTESGVSETRLMPRYL